MTPFKCGREDIWVIVLRTSEGDASGTNGNNPNPFNLLIEGAEFKSGEEEQNSFRSLVRVFASAAESKSNHGFAELSEESKGQKFEGMGRVPTKRH